MIHQAASGRMLDKDKQSLAMSDERVLSSRFEQTAYLSRLSTDYNSGEDIKAFSRRANHASKAGDISTAHEASTSLGDATVTAFILFAIDEARASRAEAGAHTEYRSIECEYLVGRCAN